jgi:hypothetical protein
MFDHGIGKNDNKNQNKGEENTFLKLLKSKLFFVNKDSESFDRDNRFNKFFFKIDKFRANPPIDLTTKEWKDFPCV